MTCWAHNLAVGMRVKTRTVLPLPLSRLWFEQGWAQGHTIWGPGRRGGATLGSPSPTSPGNRRGRMVREETGACALGVGQAWADSVPAAFWLEELVRAGHGSGALTRHVESP